jgi:hypothetical protein
MSANLARWEFLEIKITHGEIQEVDGEFQPSSNRSVSNPYDYVKDIIADGWELVTRSGSLTGEFSIILKRPLKKVEP